MILVLTEAAADDLQEAYDFIAKDSAPAADHFLKHVKIAFDILSSSLVRGRAVTLKDGRRVRAWSMPPYWIYHLTTGTEVVILRIYHQARRPLECRGRRRPPKES